MLMMTLLLLWSKCTVTERMPSSSTSTERGKRKKATSEEASRHSTMDNTTYSFLNNTTHYTALQYSQVQGIGYGPWSPEQGKRKKTTREEAVDTTQLALLINTTHCTALHQLLVILPEVQSRGTGRGRRPQDTSRHRTMDTYSTYNFLPNTTQHNTLLHNSYIATAGIMLHTVQLPDQLNTIHYTKLLASGCFKHGQDKLLSNKPFDPI